MTWLNWFMAACAVVMAVTLVDGLRKGELPAPVGHMFHVEFRRETHPRKFWGVFGSYVMILAVCVWAAVRW